MNAAGGGPGAGDQLSGRRAARVVVAGPSAIDTMTIIDRQPRLLNKVSVEKICRKAYGLMRAYRGGVEPVAAQAAAEAPEATVVEPVAAQAGTEAPEAPRQCRGTAS